MVFHHWKEVILPFCLTHQDTSLIPSSGPPALWRGGPDAPQQIGSCARGGQAQSSCCFKDLWLHFLCGSWKARVTRLEFTAEPLRISPAGKKKTKLFRVVRPVAAA
jgi:hypothetical protein